MSQSFVQATRSILAGGLPPVWGPGLVATLLAVGLAGCAPGQGVVRIDPAQQFQRMRGWETHVEAGLIGSPAFFDFVVEDVGINRARLEVRSGAENTDHNWTRMRSGDLTSDQWRPLRYATINDNDDPWTINPAGFDFSEMDNAVVTGILPLKTRLEARGERLFLNVCYVAFTAQITTGGYIHHAADEYAEFVLATYLHLRDRFGLVPDAWEVLLEPDNDTGWTGEMMGRAMVAAAARLREHGFTPAFIAPSVSRMRNAARYIDGIARVPGAMDLVTELSYHRYGLRTTRPLDAIAARAVRFNKPTAMLELWFGAGTHEVLYEDLTRAGNVAWQGVALPALVGEGEAGTNGPFHLRDDLPRLRQYFRYVRAGAVRIGAETSAAGWFDPVAFRNTDGNVVVIVKARAAGTMVLQGLAAGRYEVSSTGADGMSAAAVAREVSANEPLTFSMPAASVLTIAGVAR